MAHRRTPRSIRWLDLSKYLVLLVVALALIVLLLTKSCQPPAIAPPEPDASQIAAFTAEAQLNRPVLISPLPGTTMAPGAITLAGEGARGHSVRVRADTSLLASVPVDANGQWSATVRIDEPGIHAIVLEQVDPAGVVVASGEPLTLSIGVPAQIVVAPALDRHMTNGDLSAGPLRLSGTGEPNSTIQVVVDGAVLTETTVDATGKWAVTLRINTPGLYAVALRSLDANGEIAATATPTILNIARAARPLYAIPPTETPTAAVAGLTTISSVIVNTDPGAARIAASGMGVAGVEVQLILDGTAVSTTTIGEAGNWSLVVTLEQPDAYAVAVRAVDPTTGVTTDVPVPAQRMIIALPTPTSTPPASATPEIDTSASVTFATTAAAPVPPQIDRRTLPLPEGPGPVTLEGTGAPGDTVRVSVDGEPVGLTVVDADGRWRILAELPAGGSYTVQPQRVTLTGEVLAAGEPVKLIVPAATSPPTPSLSPPAATPTSTPSPVPTATATHTATPRPTATATPTSTLAALTATVSSTETLPSAAAAAGLTDGAGITSTGQPDLAVTAKVTETLLVSEQDNDLPDETSAAATPGLPPTGSSLAGDAAPAIVLVVLAAIFLLGLWDRRQQSP